MHWQKKPFNITSYWYVSMVSMVRDHTFAPFNFGILPLGPKEVVLYVPLKKREICQLHENVESVKTFLLLNSYEISYIRYILFTLIINWCRRIWRIFSEFQAKVSMLSMQEKACSGASPLQRGRRGLLPTGRWWGWGEHPWTLVRT